MEKDTSICKWSVQINGMCPYKEMLNMILNDFDEKKTRCEGKQCLNIILKETGKKNEEEVVNIYAPNYKKPKGPAKSTKLINNFNIEDILKDFSLASLNKNTKFTNGPFYNVRFEMSDFLKSYSSDLRDLDFKKLYDMGFRTFGCILNTDTWSGPGKHWVCIFGTINSATNIKVEYFNSSGRTVEKYPSLLEWKDLKKKQGYNISINNVIPSSGIQRSDTECGVWCLFYIKCRLEGKPEDYFIKEGITDEDITKGRKYLFTE